jgi:putative hydrolase of the HAD superfamily
MTASLPTTPPPWPRPRGLLLDAMGTVIGLRQSVGHSYAAVARDHGLEVEAAAIDAAFASVYRQAPPLAFGQLGDSDLAAAERRWWGERIVETFNAIGAPSPAAALQHALFDHFADAALWQVYPDVEEQLRQWRQAGLKLAVVSNFDRRLHGLLAELGLLELLDAVIVSSEAGAAKPDPRPFQLALTQLQLGAHEAWHIGDSPEDVAGARAAGLPCVLVQRP